MERTQLEDGLWVDVHPWEAVPADVRVHPALLESFRHREKLGKLSEVDGQVLFVLRRLVLEREELSSQDLTLVLAGSFLVTCHEEPWPLFDQVRADLDAGRLDPRLGAVVWRIADLVTAEYLRLLDQLHEDIDRIEAETLFNPRPKVLEDLLLLKRRLIVFRTRVAGSREVLNLLARLDLPGIDRRLKPYFLDVYDHLILAVETVDMFRDLLSSAVEAYLSTISNRLNEVMKTLTIIATIMMPLTVITGFYGMNFHMPETDWIYGYPFVLSLMAFVTGIMLLYFRRRRWL